MMKKILTILLFIPSLLFAEEYYVKNGGNDGADGKSDGNAWATISKVNGFSFAAGDTIYFKCGSVWREQLTIPRSGTAGAYMYFTSYGTGERPEIRGSNTSTWTNSGGNIWISDGAFTNPRIQYGGGCWFIETDGSVSTGTYDTSPDSEYDWYWSSNKVYVYAATDPDSRYTSVEVSQRTQCIQLSQAGIKRDYLHFENFGVYYANEMGFYDYYNTQGCTGLVIRNCDIGYFGFPDCDAGYGIHACYNLMVIEYDTIHDCGRRNLSISNWYNYDVDSVIVRNCKFYNGYHVTGIDVYAGVESGDQGDLSSVYIYDNLFYEDPDWPNSATAFIEVQGRLNGVATGYSYDVFIYNNIFMYTQKHAIHLFDYVVNVNIYNNTFYKVSNNVATGTYYIELQNVPTANTVNIKNNIFADNAPYPASDIAHIQMSGQSNYSGVNGDYNLHYSYSSTNNYMYLKYGGTGYNHTQMATLRSAQGKEVNAPNVADPLFVDDPDDLAPDELSPAVDEGIGLGFITTLDYYGNARDGSPDIGSIEYDGEPPDIPPDLPTVVTNSTITIKYTRLAYGGGNVTDDGGGSVYSRGLCWSTSSNPTINDNAVSYGSGTGEFSGYIENLQSGTTYHLRAWAVNPTGISYGEDYIFETPVRSNGKINGQTGMVNGKRGIIH